MTGLGVIIPNSSKDFIPFLTARSQSPLLFQEIRVHRVAGKLSYTELNMEPGTQNYGIMNSQRSRIS
jgi:hypothetical protein